MTRSVSATSAENSEHAAGNERVGEARRTLIAASRDVRPARSLRPRAPMALSLEQDGPPPGGAGGPTA